jgi:hypothetical protein
MNTALVTRWEHRLHVFVAAAILGGILGAISGALALPVMAIAAGIQRGESLASLIGWIGLLAFAPIPGTIGLGVGVTIGVAIGLVVAVVAPYVRAGVMPWFVRSVVLVATIAATLIAGNASHYSVIWFVIPGVFAIVLGQVGAHWLIKVAQQ